MFVLSIVLTSLFSLFYVTRELHRFLHRGKPEIMQLVSLQVFWGLFVLSAFRSVFDLYTMRMLNPSCLKILLACGQISRK